jgi:hypothetical protein
MIRLVGLVVVAFHCAFAVAEFEIKAHYGQLSGKPDAFNKAADILIVGNPDISNVVLMGADAIYAIPVLPFSVGLRYEMFDFKKDGPVTVIGFPFEAKTQLKGDRVSLLGGWRLIETPIAYFGFLAHFAVSQKMEYNDKICSGSSCSDNKYTGTMESSYGAGVDAGITLGSVVLGAEIGYTIFKAKDMKKSDGSYMIDSNGKKAALDLSGTYFKGMVGLSF